MIAAAALCLAREAYAEPALLGASVLYESPTLVVPALFARVRGGADELRISQVGWTSSVEWLRTSAPDVAFAAGVALTPWFAHASDRMYRGTERDADAEFGDTSLLVTAGMRLRHDARLSSDWRALVLQEWVSDLDRAQASFWRRPYLGAQLHVVFADLRAEEPLRYRVDGIKGVLDAQFLSGDAQWGRTRLMLQGGRSFAGRLFVRVNAAGFWISTGNTVARELIGGSWDALEGLALYGHPYAELRAQRGASANLGADVRLYESWELGIRSAAFADERGVEQGQALLTSVTIEGVLLQLGVATPNGDAFIGRLSTLRAFATASAVLLLP